MNSPRLRTIAVLIGTTALVQAGCVAPAPPPAVPPPPTVQAPPPASPAAMSLTPQQLDQLVAPVALYADPLLADVLTASTYPLEIVEAQRWLADPKNAALKGDALTAALAAKDWDPSIKSLVPFPPILQLLDGHLDWTEHLGEAFLAQQGDVMDAVQRLRHRAQGAGLLKSSPQQTVASDGDIVAISPPPSQVIYVPAYDPWCVYGPWPYPPYPPFYYAPWPGVCGPADYVFGWDFGLFLPWPYWEWGFFDWHHHEIGIHRDRYDRFHPGRGPGGDVWHHDPAHRGGVPYRDAHNAGQFQSGRDYHQSFRGYEGRDGEPAESGRRAPPAFENFGSGRDTSAASERGMGSLHGMSGGGGHGGGGQHR
jgi:hypothetical protein